MLDPGCERAHGEPKLQTAVAQTVVLIVAIVAKPFLWCAYQLTHHRQTAVDVVVIRSYVVVSCVEMVLPIVRNCPAVIVIGLNIGNRPS